MLGETRQNNDVYIFFENDEIERLGHEKIKGTYFNFKDSSKTCSLEAFIDDEMGDIIKTSGEKDEEGFFIMYYIRISRREYETLKERRTGGTHEGFRHIELLDASNIENLNFGDGFFYKQLQYYESQHSQ